MESVLDTRLWKGVLKDNFDLSSIDYASALTKANPLQVLLMGSAAKLTGPKVKTVFVEDLAPEEAAKMAPEPPGLVNLGNTCYLNSVVQCMRAIPSFRKGLDAFATNPSPGRQSNAMFLRSLRETYHNLDRTASAVPPSNLVMATKMAFPEFARTGPQGQPMQQDAEEFFSGLLTIASGEMEGANTIQAAFGDRPVTQEELGGAQNLVDAVFGMKMEETLTCDELTTAVEGTDMDIDGADAVASAALIEPPVKSFDLQRKLVCNIQGGSDASSLVNVNHIAEGIELALNGKVEKHSEALGRDAVWTRKQRIARLPPVLVVQFGRFYWKETPDSQDHTGVKCKVMKPVTFQGTLDAYEFCSEDVQKVLKVSRDKFAKEEEERVNAKLMAKEAASASVDATAEEAPKPMETEEAPKPMETEEAVDEDESAALQAALAMSMKPEEVDLPPVGPGLPAEFQGIYELFAVVTHKGRDADGGHYMSWVKADHNNGEAQTIADTDEANEDWFVFDDDEVSPCKTEDVLKLKGGGDWHMSYLNFYRAKK
eukprot:scaffold141125_cov50-Attheya_sp.AAC.1